MIKIIKLFINISFILPITIIISCNSSNNKKMVTLQQNIKQINDKYAQELNKIISNMKNTFITIDLKKSPSTITKTNITNAIQEEIDRSQFPLEMKNQLKNLVLNPKYLNIQSKSNDENGGIQITIKVINKDYIFNLLGYKKTKL